MRKILVVVKERDELYLLYYEFRFSSARFNKIIKIKMYIRTLFRKLRKTYSNIQQIKCSYITIKWYVFSVQTKQP